MEVRELRQQEREAALDIIWQVFLIDVAPTYTQEGIDRFEQYLAIENIEKLCESGALIMFGAFDEGELVGTISIQSVGHICNFYVKHSCQGKGAGRKLYETACQYGKHQLKKDKITVDAAPGAVEKYIHMGMKPTAPEQMIHGKRYTPMEREI